MNNENAAFAASMRHQAHELADVLARLTRARHDLIPAAARTWQGPARAAFDTVVRVLDHAVALVTDDVRQAHLETLRTITALERHE